MARILVVEDDPWSLRIACDVLLRRGHEVFAAEAVDSARIQLEFNLDLVLLDIHIPGGGGELLLKEIRANASLADLPVIALTSSAMAGDRERFLQEGFSAYMSKPIDVRTFAQAVEYYVRGTR